MEIKLQTTIRTSMIIKSAHLVKITTGTRGRTNNNWKKRRVELESETSPKNVNYIKSFQHNVTEDHEHEHHMHQIVYHQCLH